MNEVPLKSTCYTVGTTSVFVKAAKCMMNSKDHIRVLDHVALTQDVLDWLDSNTRSGWKLLKKTKTLRFKDQDEAFHFRMRW